MRRKLRPSVALALVALISAGCGSNAPSKTGTASDSAGAGSAGATSTAREKAVRFAQCMRDNGVNKFPDPDASGELTIDGAVNSSSLNPDTAVFKEAIGACKDLQPPGFTGHKRSAAQQDAALAFAQCMRDNGVKDFPDPAPDGPLIDTGRIPSAAGRGALSIPGFTAATQKCSAAFSDELGLRSQ
jgi:hypothetical protein